MSFTVVPFHNLDLPADTHVEFGNGFILQQIPTWLREETILKDLSRPERESVFEAKLGLVAEYNAAAIGEPDPTWKGKELRSIQKVKSDSAILANIALWLIQPSSICYTLSFHAISWNIPGQEHAEPIIQLIENQTPVHCHPKDLQNVVTSNHVQKAAKLHAVLVSIPRKNPVWEALRSSWAALTTYSPDRRYPFLWMALESLGQRPFSKGEDLLQNAINDHSWPLEGRSEDRRSHVRFRSHRKDSVSSPASGTSAAPNVYIKAARQVPRGLGVFPKYRSTTIPTRHIVPGFIAARVEDQRLRLDLPAKSNAPRR